LLHFCLLKAQQILTLFISFVQIRLNFDEKIPQSVNFSLPSIDYQLNRNMGKSHRNSHNSEFFPVL